MSLRVLSYRVWRLRRLLVISVALGCGLVFWLMKPGAPFFDVFLACAVVLPVLHVLAYPGAPHETLAVPISLVLPMIFADTLGAYGWPPDRMTEVMTVGVPVLLAMLALCVFLLLAPVIGFSNVLGRGRRWEVEASDTSTAAPEDLMRGLGLAPGRTVGHALCGPADETGAFDVRSRFDVDKPLKGAPDPDGSFDWADDGTFDVLFRARVVEARRDLHVVETWQDIVDMKSRVEIRLEPRVQKTRVFWREEIRGMTVGQRVGFWLEDYLADALTEGIDEVEGRPRRANRAFPRRQFVVDVFSLLFPGLRRSADDEAVPPH